MFYYYDPTYVLILIGAIVALYAQIKVSTIYAKWQKVPSSTRMTGAQIARQILDNNGCQDVRIEAINGKLTDHYDPKTAFCACPARSTAPAPLRRWAGRARGGSRHSGRAGLRAAAHPLDDGADCQHRLGRVDSAVHARPDPLVEPLVKIGIFCFALAVLFLWSRCRWSLTPPAAQSRCWRPATCRRTRCAA